MPREYGFVSKCRLVNNRVKSGKKELSRNQFNADNDLGDLNEAVSSGHPLSCYIDEGTVHKHLLEIESVFDWLDKNATGSWFWDEGAGFDISIYIDKISDQRAFERKWHNIGDHIGHDEYGPDVEHYILQGLAIVYGVLPVSVYINAPDLERRPLVELCPSLYPRVAEEGIPADFMDYLKGKIELDQVKRPYRESNYQALDCSFMDKPAPDEP